MEKNYRDFELDKIFEKVLAEYKNQYRSVDQPKVILIGGQPGAGKSGMLRILNKNNDFIFINGDEYRELHPRYKELEEKYREDASKHTNEWASAFVKKLLEELYKGRYNLIIEGTLRTLEVPKRQAEISKNFGYDVELCVLAVKPEISYLSTILRYEKMLANGQVTRMSPRDVQIEAANNICDNLDNLYKLNLFENIRLFNREDEEIYSLQKTKNINPAMVLKNEFSREWNQDEISKYTFNYEKLIEILKNRNASIEKIQEAEIEKNKFSLNENIKINFPTKYDLTLESEVLREFIWEVKAKIYKKMELDTNIEKMKEINNKLMDYLVNLSNLNYNEVLRIKDECQEILKGYLSNCIDKNF